MPVTVLVVEDHEMNRILIRDILGYHGFEVLEAGDGVEGIRMAMHHRPDVIIMDIQLPLMDGFTAGQILKANLETRSLKIIALTSLAMQEDRERALDAGFDSYLAKPFDTRRLPGLVRQLATTGRCGDD